MSLANLMKPSILVVDDDPSVGEVIIAFFSKLKGYTVYTTQNPEEAVDLSSEARSPGGTAGHYDAWCSWRGSSAPD